MHIRIFGEINLRMTLSVIQIIALNLLVAEKLGAEEFLDFEDNKAFKL